MVLLPCGNCCSKCIVFKSEGWAGWIVDEDMGFLAGNGAIINGEGFASSEDAKPFTLTFFPNTTGYKLEILFSATIIRATFTFGFSGGVIVLESSDVNGFDAGSEVAISTVVSNTTPQSVDLYNKKMVDAVGTLTVRRGGVAACECTCQANYFKPSAPDIEPETYTLQFTNVAARPSGPRGPASGDPSVNSGAKAFGKYSSFVPPNSVDCVSNPGTIYENTKTLSGCDGYLSRVQSPIILRRVLGASYRYYASDPISIRPCAEVRYLFRACGASPSLAVYSQAGTTGSLAQTSLLATIYSDKPPCIWPRPQYESNPDAYEQAINSNVYTFGNFATVSPGGTYSPETRTVCAPPGGGAANYGYSLAEGCGGVKCPPSAVIVTMEKSDSVIPAGSYSVPLNSMGCGAGGPAPCDFFAGLRTVYYAEFSAGGMIFNFTVYRNAAGFQFPTAVIADDCGCESRVLSLLITFRPVSGYAPRGSSNASRYPSGNRCFPICSDGATEAVFDSFPVQYDDGYNPTFSYNLGRVTVKL